MSRDPVLSIVGGVAVALYLVIFLFVLSEVL